MNYKPKKTSVDGKIFDSALEAKAYRLLVSAFGRENVECQSVLRLNDRPTSRFLPAILHRVDFLVKTPKGKVYIEIKGQLYGRWLGKAEYIKILELIEVMDNITYVLWVGNGDLGFENLDRLYFSFPMPNSISEVLKSVEPRWSNDF